MYSTRCIIISLRYYTGRYTYLYMSCVVYLLVIRLIIIALLLLLLWAGARTYLLAAVHTDGGVKN